MPRFHNRLGGSKQVEALKEKGLYADGGNLYLKVSSATSRSWIFRYELDGQHRWLGLGPLHTLTLAKAREQAALERANILAGNPPQPKRGTRVATRQAVASVARVESAKQTTMSEVLSAYLEAKSPGWKSNRAQQIRRRFETYAAPVIGQMLPGQVTMKDVHAIIQPLWVSSNPTARNLRGEIEDLLGYASVMGLRDKNQQNPAVWKGNFEHALSAPNKTHKVKNQTALDWQDMPAFMAQLKEEPGIIARALEVQMYCQSRPSEIREMRWGDLQRFDSERPLWAIEAEDMKAGRKHLVPLSQSAVAILRALPRGAADDYVFQRPAGRGVEGGGILGKDDMLRALKKMGHAATTHGTARSTFKTWATEATEFGRDRTMIELALAHNVGDSTEESYLRGGAVDRRRELIEAWAGFLDGKVATDPRVRSYETQASEKVVNIIQAQRKKAA